MWCKLSFSSPDENFREIYMLHRCTWNGAIRQEMKWWEQSGVACWKERASQARMTEAWGPRWQRKVTPCGVTEGKAALWLSGPHWAGLTGWHSVCLSATLTRVNSCLHHFSPGAPQQPLTLSNRYGLSHKPGAFLLDYNLWWLPLVSPLLCTQRLETRPHPSSHLRPFCPERRATASPGTHAPISALWRMPFPTWNAIPTPTSPQQTHGLLSLCS